MNAGARSHTGWCWRIGRRGSSRFRLGRRRRPGFTLVELLLVIALIGMFTAIFVVNFDVLLRESESEAVESAFWLAAREARTRALVGRKPQALSFEPEARVFLVEEDGGSGAERFPISQENWKADLELEVALQKRIPPSQFSLVGGQLVELREIPNVRFFPDGTCTPFVLSLKVGSAERSIEIDPWTGAELLKAKEE